MKKVDLTNQKFGRLTAISYDKYMNKKSYWNCICDCGNTVSVRVQSLTSGKTSSCGCLKSELTLQRTIKHGMAYANEYKIWCLMKARCYNRRSPEYHRYGGRGIFVSDEWRNSFSAFYRDMGDRPEGYSIERIDNDKGYSKENCKWATYEEQCNNKSTNIKIEINNQVKSLKEWANISGIKYRTILGRLTHHWNPTDAIFKPIKSVANNG